MTEVQRDMSFFMAGQAAPVKEEKVYVSKRFTDKEDKVIPFIMKPIPTEEIEILEKDCMEPVVKNGREVGEELNRTRWIVRMGIESTVYPNFKDKELLKSYGVVDPVDAVKKMLSVGGEHQAFVMETQRINGYGETFNDLVDEAKN